MDDPDQVAGYVARTLLGEATTPESLAAGAWSTAYALTIVGRAMVLRVSRYGGDFAKDEAVSAAVGGMLPVPAITARGEAAGWAYAVSERLTGTALGDLDASALAVVLPDLFDVMDAIGRIEVGGHGYGIWDLSRTAPYRSWPEYLLATEYETPRVPGWRAALAASDIGLEPFERGLATLRRLAPDLPDERRMIHDDLLARNVLVEGDRISGVLDWAAPASAIRSTTPPGCCTAGGGTRSGPRSTSRRRSDAAGTRIRRRCARTGSILAWARSVTAPPATAGTTWLSTPSGCSRSLDPRRSKPSAAVRMWRSG